MPRKGRPPHPDQLTPAEWRVVEFVRRGQSTAANARLLSDSPDAVMAHARVVRDKLGRTHRRELRHWPGVRKGSSRHQPQRTAMPQLSQISRRVENLDRARAFWRDTLQISELYAFPGLAFFDLSGTRLMLKETGKRDEADILYLSTPDMGAAYEDLIQRGAVFTGAPHLIHTHPDGTEEWMAFLEDDEGRVLALHAVARP
jgi:catechol 2,3-dioxygenase-like lactoylglutathione lyase family enzyme/DNA-binding CsgD family transcriptional regulator